MHSQQEKIKKLIESDLLKVLHLDKLSEEKQDEAMSKMMESVLNRVLVRILDELGKDKEDEFMKTVNEGSDEEIRSYLENHKIDLNNIVLQESLIYKQELLNIMSIKE